MTGGGVVTPVFPADFRDVADLLRGLEPGNRPRDWRQIFDYGWRRPDEPVGYVVREGERVAGFIGMILSEITVDGRPERLCNITSWITREDASGAGALLLLQIRGLRDTTITSLSSNAQAARVLGRLGFRVLETAQVILTPTARMAIQRGNRPRVLGDPGEIRPLLGEADARILDDHAPYTRHLLAVDDRASCYAVYTVRPRKGMRTARFHYLSDRHAFGRAWPSIHRWLLARHGVAFGELDARLIAGVSVPGSVRKELGLPRLFRSETLRPDQIPELYSEIILLGIL
jgi:hypothetical protein